MHNWTVLRDGSVFFCATRSLLLLLTLNSSLGRAGFVPPIASKRSPMRERTKSPTEPRSFSSRSMGAAREQRAESVTDRTKKR